MSETGKSKLSDILFFLKNFNYEQLYWLFEAGFPKRKGDIHDLRLNSFKNIERPVFFLSTGRCGTKWFADLLKRDRKCNVYHAPAPDFSIQSKMIYTHIENLFNPSEKEFIFIREVFLAGRENHLKYAYKTGKRYIETNNYLTFFAPVIAQILPNSVFVHLYRHPGEFVRSGIRRQWYLDEKVKLKLIQPNKLDPFAEGWDSFTNLQKISWLWMKTNEFIERFKKTLPEDRYFNFNFNLLTIENLKYLIKFIDANISPSKIKKKISKKTNVQHEGVYSMYKNWKTEDKELLIKICGKLAHQYGYRL